MLQVQPYVWFLFCSSSAKKTDLRKKATLKHLLKSQSFSSGPTPRGMIEGFIAGGKYQLITLCTV